jgi:tetratricopeptide (TPR) repeat protein
MSTARSRILVALFSLSVLALTWSAPAAGDASSADNSVKEAEAAAASEVLKAYTRRESDAATAKNTELIASRLEAIQHSVSLQQDAVQSTSRFMLIALTAFAAVGFIAVVLTAYFQWRAVSRLAEFSTAISSRNALTGPASMAAIGMGEGSVLANHAVEQSNARLLEVIARLEKRVGELEHAAQAPLPDPLLEANGRQTEPAPLQVASLDVHASDASDRIRLLLDQGQLLLNNENPEEAIRCFNQALELDSRNAEALVKKGSALEKLRKFQEALECYDRAIAADRSMTIAYLYKGGLYNRMERFGEAVECYEKALRTQEKKSAA